MILRSALRRGFSLLELLAAAAVSTLLLTALVSLAGAALQNMSRTTRSVGAHDAVLQLFEYLQSDLRDLAPPSSSRSEVLRVSREPEQTTIALVRPDARFYDFNRQGYYRHVEYRWDQKSKMLTRAVWHSADSATASELASSADSSNHEANARRLRELTPALQSQGMGWREHEAMREARRLAEEAPLGSMVEEFSVECLAGIPPVSAGSSWENRSELPAALRIQAGWRSSPAQKEPRRFTLLVPLQTSPTASP